MLLLRVSLINYSQSRVPIPLWPITYLSSTTYYHLRALDIYRAGLRPLLFNVLKSDPEWLHEQTIQFLNWLAAKGSSIPAKWMQNQIEISCCLTDARLEQKLLTDGNGTALLFKNPMGLAAGFDKNGTASSAWSSFGFGFAELGTVTLWSQPGNPRPRLFRLPLDKAGLNRMGFNNDGAEVMATQLFLTWQHRLRPIPIGINLGKSKVTPLSDAPSDYVGSFRLLKDWGDYFVVNVSSPNTPGLRSLQEAPQLSAILSALQEENQGLKPILVKISPDLEWEAIGDVIEVATTHKLAGIIATNTTISRENLRTKRVSATGKLITEEAGGISGAPLRERSTEIIRVIWRETKGQLPIIGVGGIFTADDAWEKITAGASLIQTYTGWIYEGPWMVKRILQGLLNKLEERGLSHISEAVGLQE